MTTPTFSLGRRVKAIRTLVRPRVFTARSPDVVVRERAHLPAHRPGAWTIADASETSVRSLRERLASLATSVNAANLHAVVIARGDHIVAEHYGRGDDRRYGQRLRDVEFSANTLHDIRSVTKSVTGLLYGIALGRGEVPGPDELLVDHFLEYRDAMDHAGVADLTVHHVLSMTMGARWSEQGSYRSSDNDEIGMELAPDRYRYILSRERIEPVG